MLIENLKNPTDESAERCIKMTCAFAHQVIDAMLDYALSECNFTEPQPLWSSGPVCDMDTRGIYIIHHDDIGIAYIGMGQLKQRRYRHMSMFNKKNGRSKGSASPAAKKMKEYDKNKKNWSYSYYILPEMYDANIGYVILGKLEEKLCEIHNPPFNNSSMAGK